MPAEGISIPTAGFFYVCDQFTAAAHVETAKPRMRTGHVLYVAASVFKSSSRTI
jgi:hypothetical protein